MGRENSSKGVELQKGYSVEKKKALRSDVLEMVRIWSTWSGKQVIRQPSVRHTWWRCRIRYRLHRDVPLTTFLGGLVKWSTSALETHRSTAGLQGLHEAATGSAAGRHRRTAWTARRHRRTAWAVTGLHGEATARVAGLVGHATAGHMAQNDHWTATVVTRAVTRAATWATAGHPGGAEVKLEAKKIGNLSWHQNRCKIKSDLKLPLKKILHLSFIGPSSDEYESVNQPLWRVSLYFYLH